jgi:formyltetrahydrofolate hydrolase
LVHNGPYFARKFASSFKKSLECVDPSGLCCRPIEICHLEGVFAFQQAQLSQRVAHSFFMNLEFINSFSQCGFEDTFSKRLA